MTSQAILLIEYAAAALGLVNIALLVFRSVWNFPFGMAMVALYILVFYEERLYAEAGLQVFFFAAQAWGWWMWSRAGGDGAGDPGQVPVRWLDTMSRAVWLLATAALSINLGWVMHRFTDAAVPYADSAIAGASVAAQILLGFRRIENWVLWIVIDIAAIALYIDRGLYPTAGLYGGFLVMSLFGLKEWVEAQRRTSAPAVSGGVIRVCFHGAESTGKSVLAGKLAAELDCPLVPEYGREYCEARGTELAMADLLAIAAGQDAAMREACAGEPPLVLLDTDPLMTAAWAQMLFGEVPEAFFAYPRAERYLLFAPDVPWLADGTRFFGTAEARSRFAALAEAMLVRARAPFTCVGGDWATREYAVRAFLRAL